MKKILLVALLCGLLHSLNGQSSSAEQAPQSQWLFGLTLAPQAITTFSGDPPFATAMPVYLGPSWLSGKWGVSPFYNFGGHSLGLFLTYAFTPNFGSYLVVDQSLNTDFGIYGFGLTTPLVDNYILGFVEIGGSYGEDPGPALLIGAYFLLSKSL